VRAIHSDREERRDLERLGRLADRQRWDVGNFSAVQHSVPAVVRDSAAVLAPNVARCVFVSTISAYRDWPYAESITEESPLFDGDPDYDPGTRAWDPDAYGVPD
jgi:hypothetical protein